MKVAFAVYQVQHKYNNGTVRDEDADVLTYLQQKGLPIEKVVWDNPNIQWTHYKAVILKAPWDYHEKYSKFISWLDQLQNLGIPVWNEVDIVKWNSDKHYLADIAQKGFPVIPTRYIHQLDEVTESWFEGSDKWVIKPCISAGAKNTLLFEVAQWPEIASHLETWLKEEPYMLQPYVKEIQNGEWSLLFFGGKYSHSLLKTPKDADFRVQHYLGGKVDYQTASSNLIQQAQRYIDAFASNTLYARVDGVLINEVFHLMELELIEPYLFINGEESRLEAYHQAVLSKCPFLSGNE
jgi:glutathione synthase/RimK-type ligase-like ATP-grasp enzyme